MRLSICVLALLFVTNTAMFGQEYPMKPTEHHKVLHQDVGVWDADITMWMEGPDGKTTKSKGVETIKKYGELWTQSEFKYEFMGSPTSGRGFFGYDPGKKKYFGTWIEIGAPTMSTMTGTYDAKTKTMTYLMKGTDPQGNAMDYKITAKRTAENKKDFIMHVRPAGTEAYTKLMHIKFSKRTKSQKK